ncbi:MAG: hypothetical protein K9M97_01925, partial [Akkermansiaceae bacterium]|nr:hypothetical protein [Akkermansiaceae bacterium]
APPQFELKFDGGAVASLRSTRDRFDTEYLAAGARLGEVTARFRHRGGDWCSVNTADLRKEAVVTWNADHSEVLTCYPVTDGVAPALEIQIGLRIEEESLTWTVGLGNVSGGPLEIGDLALPLPMNSSFRRSTSAVLKHSFISGHGSFLYWLRPDSAVPYLTLVPTGDTHFEFWEAHGGYRIFIHSLAAGAEASEHGTHWRQAHTSLTLAPHGQAGDSHRYGLKFRWADGHEDVRRILVEEGGVDVQVVPGMTVPSDLSARFALRTQWDIRSIEAEHPATTRITDLGTNGEYRIYQVGFGRLGEHRLTVNYGDGRHLVLEFFSTEPLETLIRKRAAFINRCQHRDPQQWYDGLFSEWNMETQVLLGPDNYDRIKGWRIYEVSCDDPGLSKPAFLAAKNARFPVPAEVEALDYYLEHFVWGGLQQTTGESHPYGIYGIPDWKTNRESSDPGSKGKLHLWRIYDYPHVVLMYFSMYQMARNHPQIKTALTASEYLQRAYGTALAMYTVPMEIASWSAYETGLYNELVIVDLIRELECAGMKAEAGMLRGHWERKVQYFVNGKPNLFQSEYAFDSTGFESTHAIAKYAMLHAAGTDDTRIGVSAASAGRFMESQMAANLFCRGGIEPAYYYLGSDYRGGAGNGYTLSYMSQMGGGAVLDYALNFAASPARYLRLGYASYLSAWALMNTGTADSNYGYWYPGRGNDGAAGGGFEPAPYGTTWLEQPHHRGSWYYACETDLGYCAALRTAATVLADDPIFGRFCFGGEVRTGDGRIEVIPRDGVRQRFHARIDSCKFDLMLANDRFSAAQPIELATDFSGVGFRLESDNPAAHPLVLHLAGLKAGAYSVLADDRPCAVFVMREDGAFTLDLPEVSCGQHILIRPVTLPAGMPPDSP